ncbi:MAG: nitroreductase family deazaflavin-dependent oxidoreductase [Jiangellaceae bacterium]
MTVQLPRWLARLNRAGANHVMRLWAPYLPPLAVLVHRGVRSGATYRTPLLAFPRDHTLVIALIYGETDWLRNVLASGGGQIVRLGRTRTFTNPRIVPAAHSDELPAGTRWTARTFGSSLVADLD